MRVAAHDDVDAGHVLRDEIVVPQLRVVGVDAAVRDHHHHVGLLAQRRDRRLDIGIDERHHGVLVPLVSRVLGGEADRRLERSVERGGRAHHAEEADADPGGGLDDPVRLNRRVGAGLAVERLEVVVARVVRIEVDVARDDGGNPAPPGGGADRRGVAVRPLVELVVAGAHHVVVERVHEGEVGRGSRVGDLRQRALRLVAGRHGEGVDVRGGGRLPLLSQELGAPDDPADDLAVARLGRGGIVVELGSEAEQVRVLVVGVQEDQPALGAPAAAPHVVAAGAGEEDGEEQGRVKAKRGCHMDGSLLPVPVGPPA